MLDSRKAFKYHRGMESALWFNLHLAMSIMGGFLFLFFSCFLSIYFVMFAKFHFSLCWTRTADCIPHQPFSLLSTAQYQLTLRVMPSLSSWCNGIHQQFTSTSPDVLRSLEQSKFNVRSSP
ncbi:hypothetical protein BDV41DRAFT_308738 [Aspergillus transmontanensis]|uniref:Uncharacterized protein n=1 Tax=Aspergillus transmontanensis TaxID=1034304 RepID=A0A5N6VUE7_9EURO|nr:hypothetical protein BDV41DRAFT_308738 [Aspergillus transmontanensis]